MSISLTDQAAETCPDCEGKGTVIQQDVYVGTMNRPYADLRLECSLCKGEGWVEIEECEP